MHKSSLLFQLSVSLLLVGKHIIGSNASTSSSTSHDIGKTDDGEIIECPIVANNDNDEFAESFASSFASYEGRVYITGLAEDASKLKYELLTQLLELNCKYHIGVHILTRGKRARQHAYELFDEAKTRCFGKDAICADFDIDLDPIGTRYFTNRIDRIAFLRDSQREILRTKFNKKHLNRKTSPEAIIVADFDVHKLPTNALIANQTALVLDGKDHDVICSAGLMHHPFGYYDIFATVTETAFLYPMAGRLLNQYLPDEDTQLIRSNFIYSDVSQEDIFEHFKSEGLKSIHGTVPVKSCFGGLAIYRASTWFNKKCNYSIDPSPDQMRYANREDGRPCEHIIFHECILKKVRSARIAVQPNMNAWWEEPVDLGSHLFAGGIIPHGLVETDGLVTSSSVSDIGLRLSNGNVALRIDHSGRLVVEDISSLPPRIIWAQDPDPSLYNAEWKYFFLTLEKNGELFLSQQTKQVCGEHECYQQEIFKEECKPCRVVVWSSKKTLDSDLHSWILHLGQDGVLRIVDLRNREILWQSHDGNEMLDNILQELQDKLYPKKHDCIPSGNQRAINKALQGRFAEAVLCQGSEFNLTEPIRFTSSHQRLYTEGKPSDERRATIRVSDSSVVSAIIMLNQDHCEVSNVIVDGNRPGLGKAFGADYSGALINAGGECRGQIIRDVRAFEPRGWSTLHLAEGTPNNRCAGALVENNELGPAGVYVMGDWADGISMACMRSTIRKNQVVDATDVGIVMFGAPGSIMEDNVIISRSRIASGGITMVDYDPYDGNFTGSIVRRNTIIADGATVGVGIGMGPRIWQPMEDDEVQERLNFGATVADNVLKGDRMQYGYAIDGVRDWTVVGNKDEASHRGKPSTSWEGELVKSAPAGYQIDRSSSSGIFQDEFEDAKLDFVISLTFTESSRLSCIESGDQDSINYALSGRFSEAVLCPGAVFTLSSPIKFNAPYQRVYTQGHPTGDERAVLRIEDGCLATAVNMLHLDHVELSNVVVDGNRRSLGKVKANLYGEALIRSGGESRGQVVREIDAFDSRSWSLLHLAEGHSSKRCSRALVERNVVGPAGVHKRGEWSSGISMACSKSMLRNNSIVDVTDVGMALFGAPGSRIEWNTIHSARNPSRAGITMVDFDPYDGNFDGTVVSENEVYAEEASMHVGIAMGPRTWTCMNETYARSRLLHGATVIDNILRGKHMQRGFFVDGVHNWTVVGNVDEASHIGEISIVCKNLPPPPPLSGFYLQLQTSSGEFQEDFLPSMSSQLSTEDAASRLSNSSRGVYVDRPESSLKLALLMSFPNSGTTYTMDLLPSLTLVDSATNYGKETMGPQVPIIDEMECPFWLHKDDNMKHPQNGRVLTKTHCGGYGIDSEPEDWFLHESDFVSSCLTCTLVDDMGETTRLSYNLSSIDSAIHLIRDPFDNIVSRFRMERRLSEEISEKYPNTREGFQAFCMEVVDSNSLAWTVRDAPVDGNAWEFLKSVPCHTDFLRYIFWHNQAGRLIENSGLESLLVKYEDYGNDWDGTAYSIVSFLGQTLKGESQEVFVKGKSYRHFFSSEDIAKVRSAFKLFSTIDTWVAVHDYLQSDTHRSLADDAGKSIQACSFEKLRMHTESTTTTPHSSCREAGLDIAKVQTDSIVNFESMEKVFESADFAVFEAFVRLDQSGEICSIGVKKYESEDYIESEQIALVLANEARKGNSKFEAILAPWGVVVREANETLEGFLIPLVEVTKTSDIVEPTILKDPKPALEVARLMLPVTELIVAASELGVFFEDIRPSDISLVSHTRTKAFLTGYSALSLSSTNDRTYTTPTQCTFETSKNLPRINEDIARHKSCQQLIKLTLELGGYNGFLGNDFYADLDDMLYRKEVCKIEDLSNTLEAFIRDKSISEASRKFAPRDPPFPCDPDHDQIKSGFFYVDIPGVGPSIVPDIVHRIARHRGDNSTTSCNFRATQDVPRLTLDYTKRDTNTSFLWSFVADPSSNVSAFNSMWTHASSFVEWVPQNNTQFQSSYLRLKNYQAPGRTVQDIIQSYDFIGVVERFDESLVALTMILEIDLSDALYLLETFQATGRTSEADSKNPGLVPLTGRHQDDILLYEAANRSLDMTIDALGVDVFKANVAFFREALTHVQSAFDKKGLKGPCGPRCMQDLYAIAKTSSPETSECHLGDNGLKWNGERFIDCRKALDCIPSGDHEAINSALSGMYSEAVLCPGSSFDLRKPVIFSAPHQRLYTLGFPTDDRRAVLRIASESVVTAVDMFGFDHAELLNVVVDGNRHVFGDSPDALFTSALIRAGGVSKSQVIRGIQAYDTRSEVILHYAEGVNCTNGMIEGNHIGPAGSDTALLNGISIACPRSVVRNNVVTDVAGVGIGIFCAPGSIIEDNYVVANGQKGKGGITMVDHYPWNGNYSGTIVRRNVVHAKSSSIKVGFAIGPRTWQCMDDGTLRNHLLFGAKVSQNILKGDFMEYGYAVDGVRNFTVIENIDDSKHIVAPSKNLKTCQGLDVSPPTGFQINRDFSTGRFQSDFKEAKLALLTDPVLVDPTPGCIPSGDEESIMRALTGKYSEAVLCQGSTFLLRNPIVLSAPYQKIYTEGLPTDERRAVLRLAESSATNAVTMINQDYVELTNVIVDGARKSLGKAMGDSFGLALIRAGGESSGQIIRDIEARDTRSYCTLHLTEGDPVHRCRDILVENNKIGHVHPKNQLLDSQASGICVACMNSLIRNNTVEDITDSGIIVFGAPGSTIEENSIVASSQEIRTGIQMTFYDPFEGSYENTTVRGNKVIALARPIHVGLAMGACITHCSNGKYLEGASVSGNKLLGQHMIYGYAVSGVRDWTALDNSDNSRHIKVSALQSKSDFSLPKSRSFQLDRSTSFGDFQRQFKSATLHGMSPLITRYRDDSPCIPSGDQHTIETALAVFSQAILCEGAVFHLTKTLRFSSSYQKITTAKGASGTDRATLRIADANVFTAVDLSGHDHVQLSDIVVDGNKENFRGPDETGVSSGLIRAGGGRRGHVIRGVWARNARSERGSILQIAEAEDMQAPCGVLVEHNHLGPSESDGIAIACPESVVRSNTVRDVANVGIKIFGAPGSVVSDNHIVAEMESMEGALTLVDGQLTKGSFNGTHVSRNAIIAHNSTIRIAVAMGSRAWECKDEFTTREHLLWGATVSNNILNGNHMQYGFIVDGVRDWTVLDNIDNSNHVDGNLGEICSPDIVQSSPSGFLVDRTVSFGMFQKEFEDAVLRRKETIYGQLKADFPDSVFDNPKPEFSGNHSVAWLMSFPNSGTTYTLTTIPMLSKIDFATNYGTETQGEQASIFNGSSIAPFWLPRPRLKRPVDGAILTKTHCGGFDLFSHPDDFMLSTTEFFRECLRYVRLEDIRADLFYDAELVGKAIHLFRDPFDNIVSRFHHERKLVRELREKYEKSSNGFRTFCNEVVDHHSKREDFEAPIEESLWSILKEVPCHMDFLRYINWHNQASEILEQSRLPTMTLHYERYGTEWNKTVGEILDFLEQPLQPRYKLYEDFLGGKVYRSYFKTSEVKALSAVFRKLTTEKTWSKVSHYFSPGILEDRAIEAEAGVAKCTYEKLRESFFVDKDSDGCWRLEDEILKVPEDAIINRNDMELLGIGTKGVVYKAYVRLNEFGSVCTAAIKSDQCMNVETGEIHRSCIEEGSIPMDPSISFMGPEYMGALVSISAMKSGLDLPGLLPTWGVLTSPELGESNFSAILMPLVDFDPLDDIFGGSREVKKNPFEIALIMLEVAEALDFVSALGISFQDVHEKNIGILHGVEHHGVAYDSSFLSFISDTDCTLSGKAKEACNFCDSASFVRRHRQPAYSAEMIQRKDCERLVDITLNWLEYSSNREDPLYSELHDFLYDPQKKCTMSEVANLFRAYVSKESHPRLPFIFAPELNTMPYHNQTILSNRREMKMLLSKMDLPFSKPETKLYGQERLVKAFKTYSDVFVNPDGSVGALAIGQGDVQSNGGTGGKSLRVKLAPKVTGPWREKVIDLKTHVGVFYEPAAYVERNGTITVVIDSCAEKPHTNSSCFTIVQAKEGCTPEKCDGWEVLGEPNFLTLPKHCSLREDDPSFACPCSVEHPVIWYDKPMKKWRMLMHQYSSEYSGGECVPVRDKFRYEYSGGYAETEGESAAGPWIYNYFQPAYSNWMRFDPKGERLFQDKNYTRRAHPRVILSDKGGLDNGKLINSVCEEDLGTGQRKCSVQSQYVAQSYRTPRQRPSGTMFLMTHAETENKTYPMAIGPVGIEHSYYIAANYNGTKYKAPSTIIACQVVDDEEPYRGQRMQDTVTPLAKNLGINLTIGPTLVDDPDWSYKPARIASQLALTALENGTVLVSMWSFVEEFCYHLGISCENFDDHGELVILQVENGDVRSVTYTTDGYLLNYKWCNLPSKIKSALEALGYDEEVWDDGDFDPTEDRLWDDLDEDEQEAATLLGYTKEKWDAYEELNVDISPYIEEEFGHEEGFGLRRRVGPGCPPPTPPCFPDCQ